MSSAVAVTTKTWPRAWWCWPTSPSLAAIQRRRGRRPRRPRHCSRDKSGAVGKPWPRRPSRAGLARSAQEDDHGALAALATEAAARLERMGFSDRAIMAHAVAGRLWLTAGDLEAATAELDRAGAGRRRGTAAGRLAAWEAEGVARLARGDRRGAMSAMRRALAVVSDQQANLAATELRANIASHAEDAARHGLRLALETRRRQLHLAVDGTASG